MSESKENQNKIEEAKSRLFVESKTLYCVNNSKSPEQQWLKMPVDYFSKNIWNDMKAIISK